MDAIHIDQLHDDDENKWYYIDDNTGMILDTESTKKARNDEMKTFMEMGVYVYVRREVAMQDENGKMVGVRWVDIKKGSDVRSRLVAQEFATKDDRDDLFAGKPPLSAVRYLISELASISKGGPGDHRLMAVDVKRAFLYGDIEDNIYIYIYIELPDEDPCKNKGMVGKLLKAMYGTRGAPQVWQRMVDKVMVKLGFKASIVFHKCIIMLLSR